MRKSVLLPALAAAGGIVGLLVRRVYLATGFEVGTGLPIPHAPALWAMALVAAAVVVVLAVLSAGKHRNFDRCYAEAFLPRSPLGLTLQLAGVVLLAIGGFLALAHWVQSPLSAEGQRTVSVAWAGLGILALLAAAGIYFVVLKMRRGQPILSAWVTLPGFAGCLWIMSNYYENWAANPSLGQYLIPMLGALLSMLACFFMGGFAFEKGRVTVTLTLALAGGALNLMSLADGLPLADTALYLGMTFYLLASASALADSDARPEAAPTCSAHCETCAGCAPMGTLPPKEEKKKKSGGAAS